MKAFVIFQFAYFWLVWLCQSRKLNNKIDNLHERPLRLVYLKEKKSTFEELLLRHQAGFVQTSKHHFQVPRWDAPR